MLYCHLFAVVISVKIGTRNIRQLQVNFHFIELHWHNKPYFSCLSICKVLINMRACFSRFTIPSIAMVVFKNERAKVFRTKFFFPVHPLYTLSLFSFPTSKTCFLISHILCSSSLCHINMSNNTVTGFGLHTAKHLRFLFLQKKTGLRCYIHKVSHF